MKVIDDGVIKYDRSNFSQTDPIDLVEYCDLEKWRKNLFELNLIGEYKEQAVGFGNLSQVYNYQNYHYSPYPQFVITGTQTGKYPVLDGRHYTRVLDYEISKLKIKMMGVIEASSEALTHAAIYASNNKIKVVFHIHSNQIWQGMIDDCADFTAHDIPYGTIEMARATQDCILNKSAGAFCMHGHEDGIVAYGRDLDEVGKIILNLYERYIGLKKD